MTDAGGKSKGSVLHSLLLERSSKHNAFGVMLALVMISKLGCRYSQNAANENVFFFRAAWSGLFSDDSCKSNLCDIMQQGANVKNTEGGSFSRFGDDLFLGGSRYLKCSN